MSNVSCVEGVFDCSYEGIPSSELSSCAENNSIYANMEGVSWPVVVAAIIMSLMAFGIGSNDAANSWAASVGSGAIKLRTALLVGAVCEFSGTVLLGSSVANTIKEDISDIENSECWACGYCDSRVGLFQAGMLASLMSTAVFLLLSSVTSMPVSATHAVVGSVAGMTAGAVGFSCVDWSFSGMGSLIASWVISPLLAGIIAIFLKYITRNTILQHSAPRQRILHSIPFFVTFITMVMTFLVCVKSEDLKGLSLVIQLIITGVAGLITLVGSYVVLLPWIGRNMPTIRYINTATEEAQDENIGSDEAFDGVVMTDTDVKKTDDQQSTGSSNKSSRKHSSTASEDGSRGTVDTIDTLTRIPTEIDDVLFCFRVLLVFNAGLKSFAHGANDTANATGPFSAVLEIHDHGQNICSYHGRRSPLWIMILAGAFVAFGIISLGHRVIKTVGQKLAVIDYHSGFCIELGSSVSVVLATQLGIPVSTTHCQIGAVIGAGLLKSSAKEKLHWRKVGKIALTWIITVPFSALLSVGLMEAIRPAFK